MAVAALWDRSGRSRARTCCRVRPSRCRRTSGPIKLGGCWLKFTTPRSGYRSSFRPKLWTFRSLATFAFYQSRVYPAADAPPWPRGVAAELGLAHLMASSAIPVSPGPNAW